MISQVRFLVDVPEDLRNRMDDELRQRIALIFPELVAWYLDRDPEAIDKDLSEEESFSISPLPGVRTLLKEMIESIDAFEVYFTGEYTLEHAQCEVLGDVVSMELTYDVN